MNSIRKVLFSTLVVVLQGEIAQAQTQANSQPQFKGTIVKTVNAGDNGGAPGESQPMSNWSGQYTFGVGWHKETYEDLTIYDDGHFEISSSTHGKTSGTVKIVSGVMLFTTDGRPWPAYSYLSPKMIPFSIDGKRLIARDDEMLDFCNHFNSHGTPEAYTFHRNEDFIDWTIIKPGQAHALQMPALWRGYVLPRLLKGQITKVKAKQAEVNLGSKDGLKMGMMLYLKSKKYGYSDRVKVVAVSQDHSTVQRDDVLDVYDAKLRTGVKVGSSESFEDY